MTMTKGASLGKEAVSALIAPAEAFSVDAGSVRKRSALLGVLSLIVVVLGLLFASLANGAQVRTFKETFGNAAQPTFGFPTASAVDQLNGDLLVVDAEAGTVSRFHSNGTAANFSALGTNVITGFSFPTNAREVELAVDSSGGATEGDIYVTQAGQHKVDIFGPDGSPRGQLTAAGTESFGEVVGVAVDASGAVYVSEYSPGTVHKFVAAGVAPTNEDNTANFNVRPENLGSKNLGAVAAGNGASAGSLFVLEYGGSVYKINANTGAFEGAVFKGEATTASVSPNSGNVLVAIGEEVREYDSSGSSGVVKVSSLFASNTVQGIAIDESNRVYVATAGTTTLAVFGAGVPVPTPTAEAATITSPTQATLNGSVNPEGVAVAECFFEYGTTQSYGNTVPCDALPPTSAEPDAVSADVTGLEPNGVAYHFRLVAGNANGTERSADERFTTTATVVTEPAMPIAQTTATLRGRVYPNGTTFSQCQFEYGLTSLPGFQATAPCSGAIPPDSSFHAVHADLTGLQVNNATYRFRLVATNATGTVRGETLTFTTSGQPQIIGVRASFADQSSATLEGTIDPRGFDTSYRIEWGPTTSYGNVALVGSLAATAAPAPVSVRIGGLTAGTRYHYRVVATSDGGASESGDRAVESLNGCGLPNKRCFELVSARDPGPVATAGVPAAGSGITLQAAPGSTGLIAYGVEQGGYEGAGRGANVLYLGQRGPTGWSSSQLSPPIAGLTETKTPSSESSVFASLSPELTCGFVASAQPLTGDTGTRLVFDKGGSNLYRRNSDGSFTAVTSLPPANPESTFPSEGVPASEYKIYGASQNCSKVLFATSYYYAGYSAEGPSHLYEWENGVLRNLTPAGGGAQPAVQPGEFLNHPNLVSADGSRVFFTGERTNASNPGENGTLGVFVREGGSITRDLSESATSTPDLGATLQYVTPDGSRVYFTANAGLTSESSSEGMDLYEYDLSDSTLTDLSAHLEEGGAQVDGFLGASNDGAEVYFAARGELVSGHGSSFAQNEKQGTDSLYEASSGTFRYVGRALKSELAKGVAVGAAENQTTSRVSADGRYLLFETSADVTGYSSGGSNAGEAYLYDADAGSEATVCVSCRQDGQPSIAADPSLSRFGPLAKGEGQNLLFQPQSLVERGGEAGVFFFSRDSLATGAEAGVRSLYEWAHGQVFKISAEPPGLITTGGSGDANAESNIRFAGASTDGLNLYFGTALPLNWEDTDRRPSLYDARSGGGFPQPPALSAPCNPVEEGACQRSAVLPPSGPPAGSATHVGSGNPKHHKKKHHKKHKRRNNHGQPKGTRNSNGNGGARK